MPAASTRGVRFRCRPHAAPPCSASIASRPDLSLVPGVRPRGPAPERLHLLPNFRRCRGDQYRGAPAHAVPAHDEGLVRPDLGPGSCRECAGTQGIARGGGEVKGGDERMVRLEALWQAYARAIAPMLEELPDFSRLDAALASARANNLKLLAEMNRFTSQLEHTAEAKADRLRMVQTRTGPAGNHRELSRCCRGDRQHLCRQRAAPFWRTPRHLRAAHPCRGHGGAGAVLRARLRGGDRLARLQGLPADRSGAALSAAALPAHLPKRSV